MNNMNIIEVKNLSYNYNRSSKTISDVSFNVPKGSFTCIVGENGSGKSTILKCIVGVITGYKGEIRVMADVGYLPQKSEIQSNFPTSVEEVVLSGTIRRNIWNILYTDEDREIADYVMKKLKIYDIRKKAFSELSGGQQQRVLIARAMCSSDELLILDEPTNGLDPIISKQIYMLLEELKKSGLTILMVSHDTKRAIDFVDNIIEITEGRKTFSGTSDEYIEKGKLND